MSRRSDFDFGGVGFAVEGDSDCVAELERDFAWFKSAFASRGGRLTLIRKDPPPRTTGHRLFPRTPRYRVADEETRRIVDYADGSRLEWDFAAERGEAWASEAWRLREIAYLTVLSRVGEALERNGWYRVHALGAVRDGAAGLVLLPSGGGKSVLALELLRRGRWRVLSDDTPLVSPAGSARAFPLRLGFLEDWPIPSIAAEHRRRFRRLHRPDKILVDLAAFPDSTPRGEIPLRWIAVASRDPGETLCVPAAAGAVNAALLDALVVGRGIAQLSELMLRPGWPTLLSAAAAKRLGCLRGIAAASKPYRLVIGGSPADAAAALERALESA